MTKPRISTDDERAEVDRLLAETFWERAEIERQRERAIAEDAEAPHPPSERRRGV